MSSEIKAGVAPILSLLLDFVATAIKENHTRRAFATPRSLCVVDAFELFLLVLAELALSSTFLNFRVRPGVRVRVRLNWRLVVNDCHLALLRGVRHK
jgi:hypothetical protein